MEFPETGKRPTHQNGESFPITKTKLLIISVLIIINSKKVFQNEQLSDNNRIFANRITSKMFIIAKVYTTITLKQPYHHLSKGAETPVEGISALYFEGMMSSMGETGLMGLTWRKGFVKRLLFLFLLLVCIRLGD